MSMAFRNHIKDFGDVSEVLESSLKIEPCGVHQGDQRVAPWAVVMENAVDRCPMSLR